MDLLLEVPAEQSREGKDAQNEESNAASRTDHADIEMLLQSRWLKPEAVACTVSGIHDGVLQDD